MVPGNMQQTGDTQTSAQGDNSTNTQNTGNTATSQDVDTENKDVQTSGIAGENSSTEDNSKKSTGASVEALVQLGEDFLDAAFAGDIDDMIELCSNSAADDIEKDPKKYLGTKPDYKIDKIDTTIKPLGTGKYLVHSTVSAAKKDDKNKKLLNFKYSATVEKVNEDYYIIDFKKDSK